MICARMSTEMSDCLRGLGDLRCPRELKKLKTNQTHTRARTNTNNAFVSTVCDNLEAYVNQLPTDTRFGGKVSCCFYSFEVLLLEEIHLAHEHATQILVIVNTRCFMFVVHVYFYN